MTSIDHLIDYPAGEETNAYQHALQGGFWVKRDGAWVNEGGQDCPNKQRSDA